MSAEMIGIWVIVGMLVLIALRCPVALAMAAAGLVGFSLIVAFEPALALLESGPFEALSSYSLSPIPLFILMGVFASKARMSAELFAASRTLFGGWRGGIALGAITACATFSAISGSSMATAASMSRAALPDMRANGYSPSLAAGSLAAGGTLGIMIPPSIALLVYALLTEQSVGDMFVAGLLPGLLGLFLYCSTVAILVALNPDSAQASKPTRFIEKITGLKSLFPFALVFTVIIVGIYAGLITPTEGGAVGAFSTLLIAVFRGMRLRDFLDGVGEAVALSALVFFMIIGAEIFSYFLSVSRVSFFFVDFVQSAGLPPYAVLAAILLLYVLLGCVMDSLSMLLLTVPVVFPLAVAAGFDPVWFGIISVITVEMGLITPPVGMNVFVIKSVIPEVPIGTIFKGVLPFVLSDVVRLAFIIAFPWLALGLL